MKLLENIRAKPEAERIKILWIICGVVAALFIILWLLIGIPKSEPKSDTSIFKTIGTIFKNL